MTNLEIIKASYAASANGDIEGIIRDFAPSGTWTEMTGFPYGGTYTGPQQIMEGVFKRIGEDWDDFRAVPDAYYDAGETIVVTGNYSGTYRKTGNTMNVRYTHVWKLKDFKIIAMEQFTDTLLVDRVISV